MAARPRPTAIMTRLPNLSDAQPHRGAETSWARVNAEAKSPCTTESPPRDLTRVEVTGTTALNPIMWSTAAVSNTYRTARGPAIEVGLRCPPFKNLSDTI